MADVMIDTADGAMRLHEARPHGIPRGGLIVIQEAFGVNPHIEDVTQRAAAAGYFAVAPDMFHRSGPGSVVEYGQFDQVLKFFQDVGNDDAIIADVGAAVGYLRDQGFTEDRIAITGFCFGGRVTFLTSLHFRLGAAAGFYGGGIVTGRFPQFPPLVERVPEMKTPWLGLFGDQDGSIPVEDVETLRGALKHAPVDTDIVRYPEAGHGFHCDKRDDYREADAKDAWARALAWFDSHIAGA
jgi:carboxymethylenebutenolidase